LLSVVKERKRTDHLMTLTLLRASQADKDGFQKIWRAVEESGGNSQS